MRNLLFLLLLLPVILIAQQREVFRIDNLPKAGILLNQGWKWHAGDNPEWAKPDFDDSGWQDIDPTKEISELPQLSPGQIGWLRIRLIRKENASLPLSLMIAQSSASEIYLNGALWQQIGKINTDPAQIRAINPLGFPYVLQPSKDTLNIALRFVLQPGISYGNHFGMRNPLFSARVLISNKATSMYSRQLAWILLRDVSKSAIFFIMGLIFCLLYIFFPARLMNLYFSLYAILGGLSWVIFSLTRLSLPVGYYFWLNNAGLIGETVGLIFLLTSIYTLLEQPKRWTYWGFFLFCLISVLTSLFFGTWGWVLYGYCTTILVSFDIARVAFLSTDTQKKGVWIIIAGNIFYLLMWMAFSLFLSGVLHISQLRLDVIFDVSMMCIPITYAIFLSYDFGHTNWVLKQKLTDIESLSAEKQSILTTQNETLERQVAERTAALKASQAQLIQSEKLASLGELTAGIAHEIQNPLNFVNNFAEVSAELLDDMKADLQAGKTAEAAEIADDLQVNLQKINHHGQRASAIVKGMLEHSRTSTGTKVATDINALADEYLRLAYHGLLAKDSNFNAIMETHFDPDLPKIKVIPQDIGRVLLNLINNAFYAVNEKNRQLQAQSTDLPGFENLEGLGYQPTVIVRTKKLENAIEISVKDNGNGIPDAIKDKIFQPFFTTKPTGQGTGLGLSLAYDIVTKGHGGTLTLHNIADEENSNTTPKSAGTVFVIKLPFL